MKSLNEKEKNFVKAYKQTIPYSQIDPAVKPTTMVTLDMAKTLQDYREIMIDIKRKQREE